MFSKDSVYSYHAIVWINDQVVSLTGGRGMDAHEGLSTHDLFLLYDVIYRNSKFAENDDEEGFEEVMYSYRSAEEKYEMLTQH